MISRGPFKRFCPSVNVAHNILVPEVGCRESGVVGPRARRIWLMPRSFEKSIASFKMLIAPTSPLMMAMTML